MHENFFVFSESKNLCKIDHKQFMHLIRHTLNTVFVAKAFASLFLIKFDQNCRIQIIEVVCNKTILLYEIKGHKIRHK